MPNLTTILILLLAAAAAAVFLHRKRRSQSKPTQPPVRGPAPAPAYPPSSAPAPIPPPAPPVAVDRNGKHPGDAGYDPRIDRPAEEFSPVEPFGAYYGEGAFDPDGRWVGPSGVHWTDKDGGHHGPANP